MSKAVRPLRVLYTTEQLNCPSILACYGRCIALIIMVAYYDEGMFDCLNSVWVYGGVGVLQGFSF